MTVIVCGPDNRFLRRRYWRCTFCECITEQVVRFEVWYDATVWCCRCGDSWAGGELHARPWRQNWRRDAARKARRLWDRATYGPPPSLQEMDPELFAELSSPPVQDADAEGGAA